MFEDILLTGLAKEEGWYILPSSPSVESCGYRQVREVVKEMLSLWHVIRRIS
jgi:hypothetical protein